MSILYACDMCIALCSDRIFFAIQLLDTCPTHLNWKLTSGRSAARASKPIRIVIKRRRRFRIELLQAKGGNAHQWTRSFVQFPRIGHHFKLTGQRSPRYSLLISLFSLFLSFLLISQMWCGKIRKTMASSLALCVRVCRVICDESVVTA